MEKEELVQNWRERIIALCESKLGRKLIAKEVAYISSLNTFLALEYLQNEAELAAANELEIHLEEVVSLFENSVKS
ncbi:MAG: hypothetical protein ACJA2Q_000793 [Pseudohongiellaceae bacterium]|jgi:hypothetical protein